VNHLANETSPYLRQHAENPVEWYPWGEIALAKARELDKPILLSVGYSSCHWCHVMAHESFENPATAALMNDLYINIKVDREERPDLDDIYMQAVMSFTEGHGGWPMTVFLLPNTQPFYGGTYFPDTPRYGMPSFEQVLTGVAEAFRTRREEVERVGADLADGLQRVSLNIGGGAGSLTAALLDSTFPKFAQMFDREHGGFSGAPKFPQPMNLEYLLRFYTRTGHKPALEIVTHTLRMMARGGIYDQIGGGFHRYSVDAVWLVPHFEKMLYDNAQLSRVYLHAWQITGDPFFKQIAHEIYDYILREMTAPEGGFYSTTDADSEGEEGKFFVWSLAEIESLLGEDAPIAIAYYGVTQRGNFEGHNILNVPNDPDEVARTLNLSREVLDAKIDAIRHVLYAHRTQRVAPGLDDKILTAWNGMMLASLAEAAAALDHAGFRTAAIRCGEFLRDTMITPDQRVWRTYNHGTAKLNGYLEDYAHAIDGFLMLYRLTLDESWFVLAHGLANRVLAQFRAPDGGFFDTSADHEALIARPRNLQDNATPAGSSVISRVLLLLAGYSGNGDFYDAAARSLGMLTGAYQQVPHGFGEALSAVDLLVGGVREVAIIGQPNDQRTGSLLDEVRHFYRPNVVIAQANDDVQGDHPQIALLSGRVMKNGEPTAYVCRNFACQLPVTTADALRGQLA
jgi:uncharacterized protein